MLKRLSLLLVFVTGTLFALAQDALPVKWKFTTKQLSDCEYDLVFTAAIEDTWHMYSLKVVDDGPLPTVIKFKKNSDIELVGKVTQGKPVVEFDKMFDATVEFYKHTATFKQRIKLKSDKKIILKGEYEWQACTDSKCIASPPGETFEFTLQGTPACISSDAAVTTTAAPTETVIPDTTNDTVTETAKIDPSKQKTSVDSAPVASAEPVQESRSWW